MAVKKVTATSRKEAPRKKTVAENEAILKAEVSSEKKAKKPASTNRRGAKKEEGEGGAKKSAPKRSARPAKKPAAAVRKEVAQEPSLPCVRKTLMWGDRPLTLETGRLARQASGSVLVTYGQTVVLCTAVVSDEPLQNPSFSPVLSVHYQTKYYAAGKIPGGFLKRESKPSDKDVLTSRLIDRPLRPLFPKDFYHEVQVVCTVLSYDGENDADIPALVGASAALSLSGVPFAGPIAGVRVGYSDKKYVINPKAADLPFSAMDLVVAGTKDGFSMVESEVAELDDDIVQKAVFFGHDALKPVIGLIQDLVKEAGKTPWAVDADPVFEAGKKKVLAYARSATEKAFACKDKLERGRLLKAVLASVEEKFGADAGGPEGDFSLSRAFGYTKERVLREITLSKKRVDGRQLNEVRPIASEVGLLPRVHGSALFTRGETQALVTTTLGATDDAQIIDDVGDEYRETFLLHYNFPPFSVGEVGRMGPPGRREVGHGKLAWRALRPLLPQPESFPYTLRVVSEITESNGSSSMATVCGTSLSLMDAGVPVRPVSGIAMGLVKEGKDYVVLSDISADEDGLGDMDFKVARTEKGITALQMDLKITSITPDIMKKAIVQAKEGCLHILSEMNKTIAKTRTKVGDHLPQASSVQVAKDKIRDIIGPGGSQIRALCQDYQAQISINDETGAVSLFAATGSQLKALEKQIKKLSYEPEVGDVLDGKVVDIKEFGAFVNLGGQDGLVHISELAEERVKKVQDVVSVGDMVRVKVIGRERGKVKLSIKQAPDQE